MPDPYSRVPWTAELHKALRLGLLPDGTGSAAPPGSRWRRGSVVVLVSAYKEYDASLPAWLAAAALDPRSRLQPVLYQRSNASMPNYAPNFSYEAGAYLQFVMDFYDDLPEVTAFLQATPQDHSPRFLCWLECTSPNASYVSLNYHMIHQRSTQYWGKFHYAAWVEQCWRDVADLAGAPFEPRTEPTITAPCCAQFIASREQLLRRPLTSWQALYAKIVGGGGVCHDGPLDIQKLAVAHWPNTSHIDFGPDSPVDLGKHTTGAAMEHLSHVVFGLQPHRSLPSLESYCANFIHNSVCDSSPCGDPHAGADPDYVPTEVLVGPDD